MGVPISYGNRILIDFEILKGNLPNYKIYHTIERERKNYNNDKIKTRKIHLCLV